MAFLHGVETLQVDDGVKVIATPATAVIGIAGVNGADGNSTDVSILGTPQLITPSKTLEEQGLDQSWPVYKAIKAIFDIASPLVIWVPYGIDTAGDGDVTLEEAIEAMRLSRNLIGYSPKILITDDPVNAPRAKMIEVAEKLRAVVPTDVQGVDVQAMLTGRATYTDAREFLVGPKVKVDSEDLWYSWIMAGMIAWTDENHGYHYSPSNKVMETVEGTEFPITASITDSTADTNVLNAQGITTVFSGYAQGYRTWGNRNASFPAASGINTFLSVIRTADVLEDAIESVSLQWIDRPINNALVDSIVESVNQFFRTKIGEGVIVDGQASFDPEKNTETEISNGHLVISYEFIPPPPLERLTFRSFININLLSKLTAE